MTEEYTFPGAPNEPPVILSKTGQPDIGQFVWIDRERQPEWPLEVRVRDENVDQPLKAHWRITHQDAPVPQFVPQDVMISNEPIRELTIRVNTAVLIPYSCHRLEIAVSGSFPEISNPIPMDFGRVLTGNENDIAHAGWWILEGEGSADTPDSVKPGILDSCDAFENLTASEMPVTEQSPP